MVRDPTGVDRFDHIASLTVVVGMERCLVEVAGNNQRLLAVVTVRNKHLPVVVVARGRGLVEVAVKNRRRGG
jgi:hypothetical protein